MRTHASLLSFAAAAAVSSILVIACGGSDDDTGPGAVSSVDSSKPASSLTESEAKQYCEDSQAYYAKVFSSVDTKRLSCGIAALFAGAIGAKDDAEAQSKCRAALDDCMNKPDTESDAGDGNEGDDCASYNDELKNCSATVGELNTCLADQANAVKAVANKDFCADAKAGDSTTPPTTSEQPASCKAIQAKCPSFAGSDSTDDSTDPGEGG